MTNDEHPSGEQRPTRIRVQDEQALQDWACKFDTTVQQILEAVKAVGDREADVEMHLKGSHATSNADAQANANAQGNSAAQDGGKRSRADRDPST